jgi:hypothetical protein
VFVNAQGGQKQFYVALAGVLAPISPVQADILIASPVTKAAYPGEAVAVRELLPSVAAAAPKAPAATTGPGQPPAQRPAMAQLPDGDPAVCAAFTDAGGAPEVLVGARPAGADRAVPTVAQTREGTLLADRVLVEPGWGALVEAMQAPDAPGGTVYLVTDDGMRFPLASDDVAAALGYGGQKPVRLPASLVARIPEGPALDPAAAAKPAPAGR